MDKAKEVGRFLRQSDHLKAEMREIGITVIGAGAIGSFAALSLAKMGFESLTVYDDDIVSEHNLPNQFYRTKDIGKQKVDALADIIYDFEGIAITAINAKYSGQKFNPGIVISAVDSISARQEIYQHIKNKPSVSLYIDSRMSLESLELFVINPLNREDQKYYEDSIKDASDVVREPCTAKTVMYTPLAAASFIGSTVTRFVRGEMDMVVRHKAVDLANINTIQIS